ncbi:hypothetical protein [Mesorhizobium sp. Cs1299R1N3]|uniref:hypothetical protein n=1 Tax=Mesorhizobium sp. Cs1299R1N3 TaxID=3015173 RepID=UPI00301E1C16
MTILKFLLGGAVAIAGAAALPSQSKASEWGCQVLLCLSGDWQGTSSCHPPIYKLIAAMEAPGFNWPTCPQANSSAARFEKYEDCPSGWQAVGSSESDRPGLAQERNICRIAADRLSLPVVFKNNALGGHHGDGTRPVQIEIDGKVVAATIQTAGNDRGHSLGNGLTYYTIPRPMRGKPWFIEYDDANGVRQKSWFNLNMP